MNLFSETEPHVPEPTRVSMLERVVPALSFGLASISGIVGAILTTKVFIELSEAENTGTDTIAEALATINYIMFVLLGLSLVIGIGALITNIVRMSSERSDSSPPGFLYLVAGLPNLLSPILVAWAWWVIVEIVLGRSTEDPAETGAWISQILLIAIPTGIVALVLLPIFSFVPFSARGGKKFTSIAALAIVIIGIAAILIIFSGLVDQLLNAPRPTINEY